MTGRYAVRSIIKGTPALEGRPFIGRHERTLPRTLQLAGYHTASVGKWHLDYLFTGNKSGNTAREDRVALNHPTPLSPLDYGFDEAFWLAKGQTPFFVDGRNIVHRTEQTAYTDLFPETEPWPGHQRWQYRQYVEGQAVQPYERSLLGDQLADRALDYIQSRAAASEPFFLFLALAAPHTPHVPGEDINGDLHRAGTFTVDGQSISNPRQQLVYENDIILGQVLEQLDRLGLSDNTVVIFACDTAPVSRAYVSTVPRAAIEVAKEQPWRAEFARR